MGKIRKLKAVRTIVRPDRREEYLKAWQVYSGAASELGARVWLYEDQELPGRFMEFTEFEAGEGVEVGLERAFQSAALGKPCLRREGDDIMYREVESASEGYQL